MAGKSDALRKDICVVNLLFTAPGNRTLEALSRQFFAQKKIGFEAIPLTYLTPAAARWSYSTSVRG